MKLACAFPWILAVAFPPATEAAPRWLQLAGIPHDLAGREMPPGIGGAWCYVPQLEGFLLYGGYSPRYTNEGWLFDPAERTIRLLWNDDSLTYDADARKWRSLLPREVVWSNDRPGPARGRAAVYSPKTRKVYLFGGHPDRGRGWFGGTRLGTWELDPATLTFKHLGETGPRGIVKAVYDRVHERIVVAPQPGRGQRDPPVTWVFSPDRGTWEKRAPSGPRPGPYPGFAFDAKIGKCIYFSAFGETWTYDVARNEWKERTPAKSPPPRWHAAMVYVPQLGGTVLHGGIAKKDGTDPWRSVEAFRTREGIQYNDTWFYDAAKNEWTELPSVGGPGSHASARDLCGVDGRTGAAVFYDPAKGIWAFAHPGVYERRSSPPTMVVSPAVLQADAERMSRAPALDAHSARWQAQIRSLGDDRWLDSGIRMPVQGCGSFDYDRRAGVLYWIGGCGGVHFGTHEDYSYNNQVFLFDMVVGKWSQRRANHPWMPERAETIRPGNGCGRAFCVDSKRNIVWTLGGVTGFGLPGTHRMQSYDFRRDRFSPGLEGGPGGSECGLVYDARNDLVVLVRGGYAPLTTMVFDPKTKSWRKGADHPVKFSQYTRCVYDAELGVLLIGPVPRNWKLDAPLPGNWKQWRELPKVVRTYAYDPIADTWRDLNPAGAGQLPADHTTGIGVTYDPQRRLVYYFIANTDSRYGAPRKPMHVAVLDLKSNRWTRGKDSPPVRRLVKGSAVYDPKRNVVCLALGRNLYLYRWKGGCPDDAFSP